ncbi:DsbA family protein [Streptomyces sp. NPDC048290]|uniref:DsbA family oxidoreductase n=1 Tax=Streptomyces sp. NPDC048290 TaxID=3155811 RepID=UPI00341C29A3
MTMEATTDAVLPVSTGDVPVVTFWSDLGCPWATLALHTLHEAMDRLASPVLIDHRAFPLELINREATPKTIVDVEVSAIAARVPGTGWRRWSAPEWTYPSTMLPPMEAVQAAKLPEVGGLAAAQQLDTALRHAFYRDSRPVAVHPVILEIARTCDLVDADALAAALARGAGREAVYAQLRESLTPRIQGSPHLFTADGFAVHNPGVDSRWTDAPERGGFPLFERYDPGWAVELIRRLRGTDG